MKLRHGTRFLDVTTGETWELVNKTLSGRWACRHVGIPCSNQGCSLNLVKEFTDGEIHEQIIIDPSVHIGKWLGQLELGILAEMNLRLRSLNPEQKRSLLIAIRGHIDKQLSQIVIEEP